MLDAIMSLAVSVLIDTWWNVNHIKTKLNHFTIIVLIDTWWNVNNNTIELDDVSSGFNRYMVECEFQVKGELICHMKF